MREVKIELILPENGKWEIDTTGGFKITNLTSIPCGVDVSIPVDNLKELSNE